MTNVLCDLHHADLFYSLQLLFEKRLGFNLYRQIGIEWYENGYWGVYPHPDTARQFLGLDHAIKPPKDIHGNYLREDAQLNKHYTFEDGIYYVMDVTKGKVQRAITLDKFKDMEFDIIISSMPQHVKPFNELIRKFQPKAKHVFQIGNAWVPPPGVSNILASIKPFSVNDKHTCFYHQEFDLDMFCRKPIPQDRKVYSMIHYMQKKDLMNKFADNLPGFEFKSFGAGMEDHIMKTSDMADAYHKAAWGWYYKPGGDGYGYHCYRLAATGTPVIVYGDHLKNKFAEELLTDGKTCVDISTKSFSDSIDMIKGLSHPEELQSMSDRMYKRFINCVNFDHEFEKIKVFLENLV